MKVRLATEKDRAGVYETMGYCFNYSQDSIQNNINSTNPLNLYEQFIVAVDDNDNVSSLMAIVPYDVYFEGEKVKFGGVAGVSSLPENRGGGNIANIFSLAFEYMKDNNMIFSGLGPFAFQFYRKYGYEWCYTWQLVNVPIDDLKSFKAAPSYRRLTVNDKELTESFRNEVNKKVNGPLIRDERIINDKWAHYKNSNSHVYGAFDENNNLLSYMVYHQEGKEIKVSEIYFKNEISREYLLNFLYRHRSMASSVELVLTTDDEIRNILPTPRLNYWHWPNKMGRVVMVKEALELLKLEDDFKGSFTLKVNDPHALWNNKTFDLSCANNRVSVKESNDKADFEVSIQRLSQLILGHISGKEAIKLDLINVLNSDKVALLNKTFAKRTTMLWQEF